MVSDCGGSWNEKGKKDEKIPCNKFSDSVTTEVLSYGQILSPDRALRGAPGFLTMNIKQDLRHFYDETGSQQFWTRNIMK
jgi:hypothetical protein